MGDREVELVDISRKDAYDVDGEETQRQDSESSFRKVFDRDSSDSSPTILLQ